MLIRRGLAPAALGNRTTAYVLGAVAFFYIQSSAIAQHISIHPLKSYRQALNEINRACQQEGANQKLCSVQKRRLKEDYQKLRAICMQNRSDERCGVLMKPKRASEFSMKSICMKNPTLRKCARRRARAKRRRIIRRKYCTKNPNARRCTPVSARKRRGYRNLFEYCKAKPSKRVCVVMKRKLERKKPEPPPMKIRF